MRIKLPPLDARGRYPTRPEKFVLGAARRGRKVQQVCASTLLDLRTHAVDTCLVRKTDPRDLPQLNSPYEFAGYAFLEFEAEMTSPQEHVIAVGLDGNNRALASWVVAKGDLNMSVAPPAAILRPAIMLPVAGIVLAHNHPSGNPQPSSADIAMTERISAIAESVNITLLDHIILTARPPRAFSFSARAMLPAFDAAIGGE